MSSTFLSMLKRMVDWNMSFLSRLVFFSSGELFNVVDTDTFNSSTKVSIGGNGLSYPSTCLYHSEQHHGLWNFNKYMKFYIV